MSTVFVLRPCASETRWLMSLSIKPGVSRVMAVMHKITRLYYHARHGHASDIMTLFDWQKNMCELEVYFEREIARLKKLVKRRCKDRIIFEPNSHAHYRIKVTTPLSAQFYRLLSTFDTLMSLVEACVTLGLFKKRRTLSTKNNAYAQKILKFMTTVANYKVSTVHSTTSVLTETEKITLAHALQSDMMPIFRKEVFDQLIALTVTPTDKVS